MFNNWLSGWWGGQGNPVATFHSVNTSTMSEMYTVTPNQLSSPAALPISIMINIEKSAIMNASVKFMAY